MTLKLNASLRSKLGRNAKEVRQEGKIPAVVYGHKTESFNLEFSYADFDKILKEAGESTIIDLVVDGKAPIKALISEVQIEPTKQRIIHADLHQVNMKEKINANIPVNLVGESRLVKEDGAILVHNISEVEIHCLPDNLIHEIDIDVSSMNDFDDFVAIKDLKLPAGVEIIHHEPTDVVVLIARPKAEKEEAPAPVAPTEAEAATPATEEKK